MNYLGIDISKETIDCCLLTDDNRQFKKFANHEKGFIELKTWLQDSVIETCCMEATGIYYEQFAEYLHKHNYNVSVVNPYQIRLFAAQMLSRTKTDKQDSYTIAEYAKRNKPNNWQPKPTNIKNLLVLLAYQDRLRKLRAREITKLQTSDELIAEYIQQQIESLNELLDKVESDIKRIIKSNKEIKDKLKLLQTIPGIGTNTALYLYALLSNNRFSKSSQFAAFLGLTPRQKQSGTSVNGRSSISKFGNPEYRSALFLPAMVAYRLGLFQQFKNRQLSRGKRKMLIIVAYMRKIAVLAYSIFNSNIAYNKNYIQNNA